MNRIRRIPKTTTATILDFLIAVAVLVIAFVLVTGGGVYVLRGTRVSIRSPDNATLALLVLASLRLASLHWFPLFGVRRLNGEFVEKRSLALVTAAGNWAHRVGSANATRIVVVVATLSLALKAYFACTNPGFYSGDDVEIHEMTLGFLLRHRWAVWDLRSPVYPFAFVFPAQWLALQFGVADIGRLVIAGRLMVAGISTFAVWLLWKIARLQHDDALGIAVIVAALFATAKLQIAFGSSELPRPVSTAFVLLAFLMLMRTDLRRSLLAGAVLGVAASLRFSEGIFLVPAAVQLVLQRRFFQAGAVAASAIGVLALLLGVGDHLYWGDAFHSLTAATDYTLVHQLSSRGYQPWWWYFGYVGQWASLPLVALAAIGMGRARYTALWVVLPLVVLSALPHKEARYAIPVVPFLCVLAGYGLRAVLVAISQSPAPRRLAPALLAGLGIGLLMDAAHYRLPRSNAEVAIVPRLQSVNDGTTRFVVEQLWRIGGHLYLGDSPVTDLDPALLRHTSPLRQALQRDTCVVLDRRTIDAHPELTALLKQQGYTELQLGIDSPYKGWIAPR